MSLQDTLKMRRGQGLLDTAIDNPRVTLELEQISVANGVSQYRKAGQLHLRTLASPCSPSKATDTRCSSESTECLRVRGKSTPVNHISNSCAVRNKRGFDPWHFQSKHSKLRPNTCTGFCHETETKNAGSRSHSACKTTA